MVNPGPLVRTVGLQRLYVSPAETVRAVDDVDFQASWGEFVCLFGHSGSGKTTLLNIVAGLDIPTAGTVHVDGRDLSTATEDERIQLRRETLGMVHQSHLLIEEFTAAENVALPVEARGVPTAQALAEAEALLERVGLEGYGHRYPVELSGGQRQRVGIARALSGGRRILLADEPTGSLDSRNAMGIFEMFRNLSKEGTLVIVASHDPTCRAMASRSVEMLDGKIDSKFLSETPG
jgi:ABC-type lipoprotein export system ATPase subunit